MPTATQIILLQHSTENTSMETYVNPLIVQND